MDFSILRASREQPDALALVVGGRVYSYATLAERVLEVLDWLARQRQPLERVAVVPQLDLDSVALLLALVESGITMVLLHPRLTSLERAELLADARADVFIDNPAVQLADTRSSSQSSSARTPPRDDAACLAILYTSGTTGRAKGAMLSRGAFAAAARASAANLGWLADDRWLLCMPLAHVGGLSILLRCLAARACVVIPDGGRFEPEVIRHVIARDRVTLASFVPTMLALLTGGSSSNERMPEHLRAILLGGASAPSTLLARARDCALPVLTTYGLTEACSQVTTQRYGTPPDVENGSGYPIDGVEVRIADDARIELRGPTVMTGYDGVAHEDAPFTADGWLRTEDFGHLDAEGRLHVLGRRQELLVSGGENIYPLEVERLLETIPAIESSCVFGTPDETWGEVVSAAIVLREGSNVSLAELSEGIANRISSHKRPRLVAMMTQLPSTRAGKLDRAAAAAIARTILVRLPGR